MASTFTTNVQLEEPARGDDVGTWDTPVNNNMTLLDLIVGSVTTISLNNSNVTLSAAQFRSKTITFNSTLTGSVTITFPTSFVKSYEIQNLCTGSSAFTITLATTAAGTQAICCPPGETVDCFNDGAGNMKFKNLGRVGEFWEHAGNTIPAWVGGCTVPPYLYCNGTTFSSATYPQLAIVLGGTTLPDCRGRVRIPLNDGTGRVTSAGGGVDGNTNLSGGGTQTNTLITANLPPYTPAGTITVTPPAVQVVTFGSGSPGPSFPGPGNGFAAQAADTATFTGTAQGGVSQAFSNLPPMVVAGITLIRAA